MNQGTLLMAVGKLRNSTEIELIQIPLHSNSPALLALLTPAPGPLCGQAGSHTSQCTQWVSRWLSTESRVIAIPSSPLQRWFSTLATHRIARETSQIPVPSPYSQPNKIRICGARAHSWDPCFKVTIMLYMIFARVIKLYIFSLKIYSLLSWLGDSLGWSISGWIIV